jgi:hypothetical protein
MDEMNTRVEEPVNNQEFWGEGIEELTEPELSDTGDTLIRLRPRDKVTIPRSEYDQLLADSVRLKIVQNYIITTDPYESQKPVWEAVAGVSFKKPEVKNYGSESE